MINYDTSRGGVQVRTEQGQKTESHLTIHDAKFTDSGNYTCSASNTQPAYIHVFVSEGKQNWYLFTGPSQKKATKNDAVQLQIHWVPVYPGPPNVGELSRRFEGAMVFIFKGDVSIVDLLTIELGPYLYWRNPQYTKNTLNLSFHTLEKVQ